jgi:hypothetical protein
VAETIMTLRILRNKQGVFRVEFLLDGVVDDESREFATREQAYEFMEEKIAYITRKVEALPGVVVNRIWRN